MLRGLFKTATPNLYIEREYSILNMKTTTTTAPHNLKITIDLVFMVLSLLILSSTRRSARLGLGDQFTPLTTLRFRDTLGIHVPGVVVGPVRLGPTIFFVVPVLVTRFKGIIFPMFAGRSY